MTKADPKKLATKKDIGNLRNEIISLRVEIREDFVCFKEELKHEFNVIAEKWFGDIAGANKDEREQMKDKIINHEKRINILEKRTGLITA